jgi:outer membrane receptor protein involved in Fe transport
MSHKKKGVYMTVRILCLWALASLFLPSYGAAQGSVTIFGTVTDTSGAVVPGVTITASQSQTGLIRQAISGDSGSYVLSHLPIGTYSVRAELPGFKTFIQQDIRVQVDDNRQVNIVLSVGAPAESVTVAAETAQVETRSGALREVVDSRRIVELPLNGRNPLQLQYLVAGAGGRAAQGQAQNESVSINGSRTNSNNYALDGGDNHDPYFNTPAIFPSPDALEEFSIQTNSYSADKGRNAGALMNAVTRSGTNKFHGTLFEFVRNEIFNARNSFATTVPPFKRNQFGGTLGGPLRRDRSFFFLSYQRTTQRSAPGSVTATLLTPEQRKGDFSALGRPLRDPLGGNFPNGVIPASRLHPASQRFLEAFVPLPNGERGLYSFSSQERFDDDQVIARLDHHFSQANHLSGRLLYNFNDRAEATGNLPGFFAAIEYGNWNTAVSDTHVFGPTIVNSFTFSYNDIDRRQLSVVPEDKTWNDFGAKFTRAFEGSAPAGHDTQLDSYFQAFSRFPLNHFRKSLQFSDVLSLERGRHFIRIGGDLRRSILDLQELFRGDPFVRFRATFTGDAAADFLLGRPTTVEQIAEDSNRPRTTEYALFVQDDWKVSSRLTLNLGLRWDPYLPFIDLDDKFSQVHLGEQSKLYPNSPPGILYAGDPGMPRSTIRKQLANLGPRFGFAFDPFGSGKTSIRGGYGIFYSQIRQQAHNQISTNQPFSIKLTINNPPLGLDDPYSQTGNPFPFTAPKTTEERARYRFLTPLTVTQWNPDFRNAVAQQWNLNIQRQFFETYIATAAYVGSKGNHLFMSSQANPALFGAPGATVDARRALFPTFASIVDQNSRGNSTYHSMQLTLNKRFSRGLTILGNYTWSKLIDDSSGDGDGPANPFNFRAERAVSNFDIPHRFVTSFIWLMPEFGNLGRLGNSLLGGWQTSGIISLESGRPFNVVSGRDNSASAVNQDRADLVGDPHLDPNRPRGELVQEYFKRDAFQQNPAGTFGTAGRNILRGPGDVTIDFGLIKNFTLVDEHSVQFRAEVFNLINRVNLGSPTANLSSNNFARITSAGSPRVIQLALKYMF